MKVLFYLGGLNKGGAERVVSTLANSFENKNIEVSIIATRIEKIEYNISDKIKIYSLDSDIKCKNYIIKNIERLKLLYKAIVFEKPSIVITFLTEPILRILLLKFLNKKIRKTKMIISVRNDPKVIYKNYFFRKLNLFLFKYSDGFVFQTTEAMNFFNEKIRKRAKVIGNPINNEFIEQGISIGSNRKKEIVTVGRLEPQKNQKMLIDAFCTLDSSFNDYKLLIYGDGSMFQYYKDYIKSKNNNNIYLMGNVQDVSKKICKSALFVLPSNYEGMPNALMEAMALGLPCISTDCPCGGPRELIKNNINGILVPVNDSKELVNQITNVLGNNDLAELLAKNAADISKKYNVSVIEQEWLSFIQKILGANYE